MSVLNVWWPQAGLVPNTTTTTAATTLPTIVYIQTSDTLATVTVSGYLNKAAQLFGPFNNSQMALVYCSDVGQVWLKVVVTFSGATATYSLATPSEGSGSFSTLTLGNGTAAAPSLNFTSDLTTGLYRSASHVLGFAVNGAAAATLSATAFTMLGNVVAGASGTAGTVTSFPGTTANGSLILAAVNNSGNHTATISNISTLAQNTVYTLADPANATATIPVSTTAKTIKIVSKAVVAGGAAAQTVTDAAVSSTSVVIANWNDTTTPCEIETVAPGTGNFVVTSTADPGASHISYVVYN